MAAAALYRLVLLCCVVLCCFAHEHLFDGGVWVEGGLRVEGAVSGDKLVALPAIIFV